MKMSRTDSLLLRKSAGRVCKISPLGAPWRALGASWGSLGVSWEALGSSSGRLGDLQGRLGRQDEL